MSENFQTNGYINEWAPTIFLWPWQVQVIDLLFIRRLHLVRTKDGLSSLVHLVLSSCDTSCLASDHWHRIRQWIDSIYFRTIWFKAWESGTEHTLHHLYHMPSFIGISQHFNPRYWPLRLYYCIELLFGMALLTIFLYNIIVYVTVRHRMHQYDTIHRK